MDPDQAHQNFGPDLDSNCSNTLIVLLKEFFENVHFENISRRQKRNATFCQNAKTTVNGLYQLGSLTLMHFQCFLISGVSCVSL